MTNQTETETNKIEFASDALLALKEYFSKRQLNKSINLPTDKLHAPLKKAIRDVETGFNIPAQETFLKVVFNNNEFKGIRSIELAKVEGEPCFILDGKVFDAKPFLFAKTKRYSYVASGEAEKKNFSMWLVPQLENDNCQQLPVKVWVATDTITDGVKIKSSLELFNKFIKEYIFPLTCLEVGSYEVEDLLSVNKLLAAKINNRFYYIKKKVYDNLISRRDEKQSLVLHINKLTEYTLKDGQKITTRPYYAEGYAPALSLKALVAKYREYPANIDDLAAAGLVVFENPLRMEVQGLTTTTYEGEEKQLVSVKVEGDNFNIYPNAAIRKAIEQGRFNIMSFDNYFIDITSLEEYNKGISIKLEWHIPLESIEKDDVLADLEADLLASF